MARHFVRLKLALIVNGFRRSWQQAIGLVFAFLYALPLGAGGGIGLALLGRRADPALADPVLLGVCSLIVIAWLIGPLLAFGLDETLDVGRLRLLPLTRRQLLVGLTAASSVGMGPLATGLLLLGALAGYAPANAGALVVAAALAGQFLLCIVASRAIVTTLSGRLRSRRGQDVLALVGAATALVFAALGQVPNLLVNTRLGEGRLLGVASQVAQVAGLAPSGWAASAVLAARQGQLLVGLGWLAALVVLVAGVARWWMSSLERSLVADAGAVVVSAADRDLFPAALGWLPRNRFGATVARELKYIWRVPQLRIQTLTPVLLALAGVVAVMAVPVLRRPEVVLAAAGIAGLASLSTINVFGADRGAVWLLVASGRAGRADLLGKNVATGAVTLVAVTVFGAALAGVTGGWSWLPWALAVAVAMLAVGYGVGDVVSALAPYPLPENTNNLWGNAAGMGCATMFLQSLAVVVELALLAPVVGGLVAVALLRPGLLGPAVAAGLVYGAVIWLLGLRLAAGRLDRHGPEFVAALSVRRGA